MAVGAVGTLLAGVAALVAVFLPHSPNTAEIGDARKSEAIVFYLDGCEQRLRAISLRAASRNADGQTALSFEAPDSWCECTAGVMKQNFDAETIRSVGNWFQAVALGGAESSAEEAYFADMPVTDRRRVEAAYDFSTRQCNQQSR